MGGNNLPTIAPIDLVSVVLLRIVAGRDDDARLTTEPANGEAELGRGTKGGKEVDRLAISGQYLRRHLRKRITLVSTVMGNGHSWRAFPFVGGEDVVRKPLCCHGHDRVVHAVGSRGHEAPHATGPKGQVPVEGFLQRRGVSVVQHRLHRLSGICIVRRLRPHLGAFSDGVEVHGVSFLEVEVVLGNFARKQEINAAFQPTDLRPRTLKNARSSNLL